MSFRLLGEVEARVDGERLDIGHARQCCVLACLLVDVNRPVATDHLINRVWAEKPPHRARNALAAYVSRLRQSLRDVDGVEITRGSAGYTLSADAASVDLHLFRARVAEARTSVDPVEAARAYDEALALWQGEPIASIDTPWVNEMRSSLETERLSVLLDRNDAALQAGRHTELVREIAAAVQANPLDERLAGQLMLAQSRSGRQADALETYRRMRDRLVDELGIDPSPSLRAVHQEVLAGSPAPMSATVATAPEPTPVAAPPVRRGTPFIGRTELLPKVAEALRAGAALTLTGVGGVGKTRLAFEAAERARADYGDGVWSCELAPVGDGSAVSHALAVSLGLPQGPGLDFPAAVVDYLRTRNLLLIVDNCEHVLADAAALIDRITAECPHVTVLVTSREPLQIEGERLLPVEPMPGPEAEELFAERAKAIRPDFALEHEPIGAVAEICRRLDGVPLAIELAAARLRVMSSLDVARRLDRLRLLSGGARGSHPRQQSVTATIDWSYRLLAEPEQALFTRLSVFAGTFDIEAVHGACADDGADEDDTLELLTGLVDKSMVYVRSTDAATRYGVLETLRAYGRERLHANNLHDVYATRHARYFADLFERGARAMYGPDEQAWIQRLAPTAGTTFTAPDFDNLRAAFSRVLEDHDSDLALRLVVSLPAALHIRVGYHSMDWVERAITIADRSHPLYPAAIGVAARGTWVLGRFDHTREIVALADGRRPEDGTSPLAYPADAVADTDLFFGDAAKTLAHYESELELARESGDAARLVWVLYNVSIAHDVLGVPEAGLLAAAEALPVARRTGCPSTLAMAMCTLGRASKSTDHERALRVLADAVELATPVQNNFMTGIGCSEAAAIHVRHGDPATAARMLIDSLAHWSQAGPGAGSQHWHTMRYVRDLLTRAGADDDVVTLNRAIAAAGHELSPNQSTPASGAAPLTGPETLAFALDALRRCC